MQMTNVREMAKNTSSKASMHGATDPHGLPVIAMTLQSTKKDKCCAPIGTGKLYITTKGQILF